MNSPCNPSTPPALFTAAQIADAISKNARVVRRWLSVVRMDAMKIVRGNPTAAWKLESLPAHVQQEIQTIAQQRGFRSAAELLNGPDTWSPEIPWNEVCAGQQSDALKLQRALMPALERRDHSLLAVDELQSAGVAAYQLEFGRAITPARWQYLFSRTLERDRGAGQFHRPELFLTGNLKRATPVSPAVTQSKDFEQLNLCIARFGDAQNPTDLEIDALWIEAAELFADLADVGSPKKVKRAILDFLWSRAQFLARSPNALRVNFDRKLKDWRENGGDETALLDGRNLKRGEATALPIPQADIDLMVWQSAHNCGGRTAQAVRELGEKGDRSGLSKQTLEIITAPHSRKSHVNRRLFAAVHPDVKLVAPHLLGKKHKDDATPSLRRDYSKLSSMTVLTADDFTMPVYMYVPDGKGWWILTRGQVLLMIDVRSLKIIGFSLQPDRNYNALVIRTLMNRTCQKWGVPRVWYFENGIWRNAHLVKGAPREWMAGTSVAELKPGWTNLGVKFIHAKKARSKPAELVGGKLQNLMERMPGYCGRDERRDCPEDTRRNKLAVEAGRVEPHGMFLGFDAWHEELTKLIAIYNGAAQKGEILKGLSPDQAFENFWPHTDPPTRFDASCWHLLAHYVSERKVGVDGITFKIGGQSYIYRDENSSALRGRTVLAWFDPECPERLGITDLNQRNPQLIQRDNPVDFLASLDEADSESSKRYEQELGKVAGHNSYPKARYQILKAQFEPTFRKNLVAPNVSHTAQTFQAERERLHIDQQEKTTRASTTIKRARKLGLQPSAVRPGDALADEGMEMMQRAAQAHESQTEKGKQE